MTGLSIFVVAGEHSGDALGAKLMRSLQAVAGVPIRWAGVGGPQMAAEGLASIFPLADVAVMGPVAILKRLPHLIRRINEAAAGGIAARPDVVVIIDSPEFTHPIARRIRRQLPDVAIVDYVSPSVWAWRPGRARRMRAYVDHVMALLPFEPEAHRRLGGPPCTYVGHPLIEVLPELSGTDPARLFAELGLDRSRKTLVVLPGSRRSEVEKLMQPFGGALGLVADRLGAINVVVPTVDGVAELVRSKMAEWPVAATLVTGHERKLMAFRAADVALAASGTVTLELALAGTPMIVSYRVDRLAVALQFLIKTPHWALSNLVLGERAFPELMQSDCNPQTLSRALLDVIGDPVVRARQLEALSRVPGLIQVDGPAPSEAAARIVIAVAERSRRQGPQPSTAFAKP